MLHCSFLLELGAGAHSTTATGKEGGVNISSQPKGAGLAYTRGASIRLQRSNHLGIYLVEGWEQEGPLQVDRNSGARVCKGLPNGTMDREEGKS